MNRHCFVTIPHVPGDHPGLLLDFRDDPDGRRFLVVYFEEARGRAVTDWLPADRVRPAQSGGPVA